VGRQDADLCASGRRRVMWRRQPRSSMCG
jgi:hypothetical protein